MSAVPPQRRISWTSCGRTSRPLIIPRDVACRLDGHKAIPPRWGAHLIGERGALGNRPLLYRPPRALTGFRDTRYT